MTLSFKNWFLRAFAILLWVALSACQKSAPLDGADADIIGGTDEVKARLRLAQTQAQQALSHISSISDSKLCTPQACDPASGVCDYLEPLSSPSRREFVREILKENAEKFIGFLSAVSFDVVEGLQVGSQPADARITSKGKVEFDRLASKDQTLEVLVQRWIHEAGHGIAINGLPAPLLDNSDLPESLVGFEFLDAVGACVAASLSYPEEDPAEIPFLDEFTSQQVESGVDLQILNGYFKGRFGESAQITGARIQTNYLQAVGTYQLSVTPSADPVWNVTQLSGDRVIWLNGPSSLGGQFSTSNNKYLMVEYEEHVGLYKQLGNGTLQEILAGQNLLLNVPRIPKHVFNDPEASLLEAFRSQGNFSVSILSGGKGVRFEASQPSNAPVSFEIQVDIHVNLSEYPNNLNQTDFQEPLRVYVAP